MVFDSEEKNLSVAVVDIGVATDARAAAAKTWSVYQPDPPEREMRLITPGPADEGWGERINVIYETSPTEKMAISALALRKDATWTVVIIDGPA